MTPHSPNTIPLECVEKLRLSPFYYSCQLSLVAAALSEGEGRREGGGEEEGKREKEVEGERKSAGREDEQKKRGGEGGRGRHNCLFTKTSTSSQ